MRSRGPQQHVLATHPSLRSLLTYTYLLHRLALSSGKPRRAKHPQARVPASLDSGPVAASCEVGPSVPEWAESDDGPSQSVTTSSPLLLMNLFR
jgi:hypothetical protein